ncbi:MAG: HAD family hydrolase [Desulfobacterales bacterium]
MARVKRPFDDPAAMSPQPTSMTPGGDLKAKIRCVLFDIYGTLFISGSGDVGLARKTTSTSRKLEQLMQKYDVGKPAQDLVAELHDAIEIKHRILKNQGIDYPEIKIDEIWQQILGRGNIQRVRQFAIEYELIVNPVYPMPNLEKMLAACWQQNLAMGIISNAQFYTPLLFEWFLGDRMENLGFDPELIFLSYRSGCAKPSETLFKMAAAAIEAKGLDTAAALFVGNDMLNDIYPAHQLGFQTALFAGDARSLRLRTDDPRCANLSADLILTDLGQLIEHIT